MTYFIIIGVIFLIFFYNIIRKNVLGSTLYKCRVSDWDYMKEMDEKSSHIAGLIFGLLYIVIMIIDKDFYGIVSSIFLIGVCIFIYKCQKTKPILSIKDKVIRYFNRYIRWDDVKKEIHENSSYIIGLIFGFAFVLLSMALMISGNDFYGVVSSIYLTTGYIFFYKCKKIKSILSIKDKGVSYFNTYIKWKDITGFEINDEKLYLKAYNNGIQYIYKIKIKDKENLKSIIIKKINEKSNYS